MTGWAGGDHEKGQRWGGSRPSLDKHLNTRREGAHVAASPPPPGSGHLLETCGCWCSSLQYFILLLTGTFTDVATSIIKLSPPRAGRRGISPDTAGGSSPGIMNISCTQHGLGHNSHYSESTLNYGYQEVLSPRHCPIID